MNQISFRCEPFEKAMNSLKEGLATPGFEENILLRDGVIQRFEYCFELGWKMIQRVLSMLGQLEESKLMSKKDLFRLAAEKGLLKDPEPWFAFLEAQNQSAHLYNAEVGEKLFQVSKNFLNEGLALLETLKKYESES